VVDTVTMYDCINQKFVDIVESCGGEVFALNNNPSGHQRFLYGKSFKRFLQGRHYDVVHIHSGSTLNLEKLSRIARAVYPSAKIIVHSHCAAPHIGAKQKFIRRMGSLGMVHSVDDFFACSQPAGLSRFDPEIIPSFQVINNGIDSKAYAFDPASRAAVRKSYGIDSETVVVGNVGRLAYEKNQSLLLHVFKVFHSTHPESVLLLVGDGPERENLKRLAVELDLENYVIFAGTTNDVPAYLSAMDVFVFPSIFEGFGMAPLEAIAAGLPVVMSTTAVQAEFPGDVCACSLNATNIEWSKAIESMLPDSKMQRGSQIGIGRFESSWSGISLNDMYAAAI
jgi:glycosyltransferase involved in cell wall biosynthesis